MTPTIFLDIDGVLNTSKNYAVWNEGRGRAPDGWVPAAERDFAPEIFALFEPALVRAVDEVAREARAQVVVSSSWRHFYREGRMSRLAEVLAWVGLTAPVVGCTPTRVRHRADAILAWLLATEATEVPIVILDDEYQAHFEESGLARWHVCTHPEVGFASGRIAGALAVLRGEPWRRAVAR